VAGSDTRYMSEALDLAARAIGFTSPNPMVGAVVVADGGVVGRGYHERFGCAHAEVNALREAGERARGATLYVTLEPCCVTGNTPPCTEAILAAGVKRVVVPVLDPNPDVHGRGVEQLRNGGVVVEVGLLRERAERLNAPYFKYRRAGLPFVTLKLAMSLDGRLSPPPGGPRWTSSAESRKKVHAMRAASDCVLTGVGTVLADDPELTDRRPGAGGRQPARAVLDTHLRLNADARLVRSAREVRTFVIAGPGALPERRAALEARGVAVLEAGLRDGRVDVLSALGLLAKNGCLSILAEGGGSVATSLLSAGAVDRVAFFIAPRIYGSSGVPSFGLLDESWWADGDRFVDPSWRTVGRDAVFEADVSAPRGAEDGDG